MNMKPEALCRYFDHTILNPDATRAEVVQICKQALEYNFFSVCVNPVHIKLVSHELENSDVKVCSVVGFPLGAARPDIKAAETRAAVADGAHEIDMVINVGALKDNDLILVENDIRAVVEAAQGRAVKVIIETCLLTREQKIKACQIAEKAGAAFVKTSTGFSSGGATCEDVALMKKTIGSQMKIKASGGIKTYEQAIAMIEAGADRIGASAGVDIIEAAS
jgi:deoxyribose-phosphate aldolase